MISIPSLHPTFVARNVLPPTGLVPTFTSGSGNIGSDGTIISAFSNNSTLWMAFDGSDTTYWASSLDALSNQYILVQTPVVHRIKSYSIGFFTPTILDKFQFYASPDNITYSLLDTQNSPATPVTTYPISNNNPFAWFKIQFTGGGGHNVIGVTTLQFNGF